MVQKQYSVVAAPPGRYFKCSNPRKEGRKKETAMEGKGKEGKEMKGEGREKGRKERDRMGRHVENEEDSTKEEQKCLACYQEGKHFLSLDPE